MKSAFQKKRRSFQNRKGTSVRWSKLGVYLLLYVVTLCLFLSPIVLHPHQLNSILLQILRLIIICFATILLAKYTIYMIFCPFYELQTAKKKRYTRQFLYEPLVSVLIPAWNEEVGLLSTVKTVLESDYPRLEIVVVNDGSTDRSDEIMRHFVARYEQETQGVASIPTILYHYQPNGGKGSALNTAIGLSHGEILVSIDADCAVHPHAISAFVRCFQDWTVMAAVGNVRVGNTRTLIGTLQYLEYLFSFYFKKADSILNTIYIIGGAAGAFRRDVFERIGGYSTKNITEDIDLSVRIQKAGMRIVYAPGAVVYTEGASTITGLMKQRLRWKRGRFQTFREHRSLFFSTRAEHNKLLTWVILPLAVFGDVQLGCEPFFILLLYLFSWLTQDFSAFLSGLMVVSFIFFVQMLDDASHRRLPYLLLAPIGWMLFYITTFVEFYALIVSLWYIISRRDLKWQKWQRKGVTDTI